jgi:hypothetical protein
MGQLVKLPIVNPHLAQSQIASKLVGELSPFFESVPMLQ